MQRRGIARRRAAPAGTPASISTQRQGRGTLTGLNFAPAHHIHMPCRRAPQGTRAVFPMHLLAPPTAMLLRARLSTTQPSPLSVRRRHAQFPVPFHLKLVGCNTPILPHRRAGAAAPICGTRGDDWAVETQTLLETLQTARLGRPLSGAGRHLAGGSSISLPDAAPDFSRLARLETAVAAQLGEIPVCNASSFRTAGKASRGGDRTAPARLQHNRSAGGETEGEPR